MVRYILTMDEELRREILDALEEKRKRLQQDLVLTDNVWNIVFQAPEKKELPT